jgi:hypothetical protein
MLFMQEFCATCHMPPARSQSALFVYFVKSAELPLGLAEGEVDEPPDAPGAVVVPPPEVPGVPVDPPDVPEGLLPLELPGAPLPLLPVWAAAKAGARATIPTKSANMSFCIVRSSIVGLTLTRLPTLLSVQQYPDPRPDESKHANVRGVTHRADKSLQGRWGESREKVSGDLEREPGVSVAQRGLDGLG